MAKINVNDTEIKKVYDCANEIFGGGIAVPTKDVHPSNWDWLDFDCIDDILTYKFELKDISDGIYDEHPYCGKTLKEIMNNKIVNGKFKFEINRNVSWEG